MKVSIITATYNSAATFADTLRSVESQTYKDIEHIIVDGQSNDATLEIVSEFPHVTKVISEKDNGIYDAMNKGIKLATGEILGILNSDDFYIYSDVLQNIVEQFEDNHVDCVYADLDYVDPRNTNKVIRRWKSGPFNPTSFELGWMPPHPTFFVRRYIYERYGAFNTSLGTAADYELMLRLLYVHKFACKYLPKTIVGMRVGGASNQNLLSRLKANKQDRLAWKMNNISPKFYTLIFKPLRKLIQYF
jgi:glycosyltransferase